MVVVGHATHVEFQMGLKSLQILGNIAVPVFFVLSGFVIRYVTRTRESKPAEYFIDRASRIYSVVLPGLAFTVLCDLFCRLIDPDRYDRDGWSDTSSHPLMQIVANLFFFSQAWGRVIYPFLNLPFWSLGYECVYYALYGCSFYARSWRSWLVWMAIALSVGPQVLFLLPVWWLGVVQYDFYIRFRRTPVATAIVSAAILWFLAGVGFWFAGIHQLLALPVLMGQRIAALPNPLDLLGFPVARTSTFAVAAGIIFFVLFTPLLFIADYVVISSEAPGVKGFRAIANATFVLYLGHRPFLVVLFFLGLIGAVPLWRNILVVVAMCAVLVVASAPIDRFKNLIRRWLRKQFLVRRPA